MVENNIRVLLNEKHVNELPENEEVIDAYQYGLTYLPSFKRFSNLKILNVSKNNLQIIGDLPVTLTELYCWGNQLIKIEYFPSNLEIVVCSNNLLDQLPNFPKSLKYIDCSNNEIGYIPEIYQNLIEINCSNNKLSSLFIPDTVKILACSNNFLPYYDLKSMKKRSCFKL
jgi:Leucine-rich repeat (LRR) protein